MSTFFQTDNFITNSSSISSNLVPIYQEDFHLSYYRQFSPKLPPQWMILLTIVVHDPSQAMIIYSRFMSQGSHGENWFITAPLHLIIFNTKDVDPMMHHGLKANMNKY